MNESFGTRLRRERERKQIPLASIAASTKIAIALLEGLEDDNVTHWPSGIFRRAYIRSYAQAIGLDIDATVREFLERYPDPLDVEAALQAVPEEGTGRSTNGSRFRAEAFAVRSLTDSANWLMRRLKPPSKAAGPAADFPEPPARIDDGPISPAVATATQPVIPDPVFTTAPQRGPDIAAAANLCTELAQVIEPDEVQHLLQRLADLLGAVGIVVWLIDRTGQKLTPAMTYGYPESVIARIANVQRSAQNATAAAFRSAQPEIVAGTGTGNGAIAIPLVTPDGCAGVLAAEIRYGGEKSEWVPAFARIFAAQLAMLIAPASAEARRAHA
jgi:hypothetical protein